MIGLAKRLVAGAMVQHRSAKIALALVGTGAALCVVTVGGAWSLASTGGQQFQPDAQFPMMAFDLQPASGTDVANDAVQESVQQKSPASRAMAKANRLQPQIKATLAASTSFAKNASSHDVSWPVGTVHPITLSVVLQPGYENETYVTPGLAYASLELRDANSPFDRLISQEPSSAMPIHPGETPEIAEEEDDAPPTAIAVPLPHAKPLLDPSLPLPKMRPDFSANLALNNPGRIQPGKPGSQPAPGTADANPGAIPLRQPPKPTSLLAFLTPQSDAPQPGTGQTPPMTPPPPNTVITPTPFGVPYVLQTQTVDTACLKPELLEILRQVEAHYGRKVVITSGYRSRGREGSLHRTCSAADIIMPGISSQSLAAYARSISAVGGVGTYCHQAMIHLDIGTPRDWKYGCGSYFAMRDGTAHWGKVPQED